MNQSQVLIVDEDRTEAARLTALLSGAGHATRHVASGREALRAAPDGTEVELVLATDALPDMPGLELVRAMKERHQPAFLPGVLLSASPDVAARMASLDEGADECLPRTCLAAELVARVGAMLRIKAAQDALRRERDELERLSVTDPLTGLFNRRWFQRALDQETDRSRRQGHPLALLLVDLDHFKRVNDRYGHDAGDDALKIAAEILRSQLRRVDVCTRWGGEEFALILPATGRAGAVTVAKRILRALRERAGFQAVPLGESGPASPVKLTASLGVAIFPEAGIESPAALFHAADAALYRAKQTGRDRVCIAPEREEPALAPALFDPPRLVFA